MDTKKFRDIVFVATCVFIMANCETNHKIRRKETEVNIRNYIAYLDKCDIFYVDVDHGNDGHDGRSPWKHGPANVGPFRTIKAAIRKIRNRRISSSMQVKLYIRSGYYFVDRQIRLTHKDSNLEILGYPFDNERPTISGSVKLPGRHFTKIHLLPGENWIYKIDYTGSCSGHVFIGDKRFIRARKPNIGKWNGRNLAGEGPYLLIKDLILPSNECNRNSTSYHQRCLPRNKAGFKFYDGDIVKNCTNLNQTQILVFGAWNAERAYIQSITRDSRLFFRGLLRKSVGTRPQSSGWRYIVENSLKELDAIGEYYCDPTNKVLYVIPPYENFLKNYVHVGSNAQLFRVSNASNVTFNGLDIKYTHDNFVGWFNSRPAAIELENCTGIKILNSVIGHLGHNGVTISECKDVEIYGNYFYDVGNYAVKVANAARRKYATPRSQDLLIANNTFDGCGVYHMLQPSCIHARGMRNIKIVGNDISGTPYAGIKIGWQKAFSPNYASMKNPVFYVAENHIANYGLAILNDFAGIYLSTNVRTCGILQKIERCHLHAVVTRNVVHHGRSYAYGAAAVYSDTASSSVTVSNNWLYDVGGPAINFHCGQNNIATNNMIVHVNPNRIFGTCNHATANGDRSEQTFSMTRNIVFVENSHATMHRKGDWWDYSVPYLNFNIYYGGLANSKIFYPKNKSLEKWREDTKNDIDSSVISPEFTSVDDRVLTLREESPAGQMFIRSIDLQFVRNKDCNSWMFSD